MIYVCTGRSKGEDSARGGILALILGGLAWFLCGGMRGRCLHQLIPRMSLKRLVDWLQERRRFLPEVITVSFATRGFTDQRDRTYVALGKGVNQKKSSKYG